jgi:hypothetical protein
MPQYWCHDCMSSGSLITPASPTSLSGGSYMLSKYMKHTAPAPDPKERKQSIFNDRTYQAYEKYVVNTAASGFLEINDSGQKNVIWLAGSTLGIYYENGNYVAPTDGVKLVFPENDTRLHAFSISASPGQVVYCATCGRSIPLF